MTSSVQASLARLDRLLESEAVMARDLLPVVGEKQRALVAGDLAQLHLLAERELSLSRQLAAAEDERNQAAHHLAQELRGVRAGHTLAELLNFLPDSELKASVRERARSLRADLEALARLNTDNQFLTQNLLDYTRMVLRLVTQVEMQPGYSATGQVVEGAPARLLVDNRV